MSKRRKSKEMKKIKKKSKKEIEDLDLGLACYRKEDWKKFVQMADDKNELEDTWEKWHTNLRKLEETLDSQHIKYTEVIIDLEDLERYCKKKRLPNISKTRSRYVSNIMALKSSTDN